GIGETEMLGDAELKRDFQFRLATLDLLEGRPTPQVLESLMAELDKALLVYSQGHERLLKLIEQRGETIEHHLKHPVRSAPTCPMSNIYLPEYLLLVELKLRIAYTLAKMGSQESIKTGRPKELWTEAVGLTATALELSQAVAKRSAMLESELWTVLGKLQLQLHLLGYFSQKTVAKTLYEALKSVIHSHHDLAAIRQLYLDLALLHLFGCGLVSVASNGALVGASADDPAASTAAATSPTNSPKTTRRKAGGGGGGGGAGKRKALSKKEKDEALQREATDVQKDRRAAWVAIKCAARVGAAQRNLSAIVGESNGNLIPDQAAGVPEPAAFDLAAAYVLGRKKRVYKNEIEEELSTMDEAAIVEDSEVYADQLDRVVKATEGVAWNSLLGYHGLLLRLCVNKSVEPDTDTLETKEEVEGLEFPLVFPDIVKGFVARPVVRTPLSAVYWSQRVPSLHRFFVDNLPAYKTACTAVYPPEPIRLEQFDLDLSQELLDLGAVYRSYRQQWELPVDDSAAAAEADEASQMDILSAAQAAGIDVSSLKTLPTTANPKRLQQPPRPPGYAEAVYKPSDVAVMSVTLESDLSVQFYRPPLDVMCSKTAYRKTLLLFASTAKVDKNVSWLKSIQCGALTVDLEDLVRLFSRFRLLAQQADLALRKVPTAAPAATGAAAAGGASGVGTAGSLSTAGGGDDKGGAPSATGSASAGEGGGGGGGGTSKKQKQKPAVEKSRTERLVEALARECLDDLHRLVTGSAPVPRCFAVQGPLPSQEEADKMPEDERPLEVPFEISRDNLHLLKQQWDPDLGGSVKTGKLLNFLLSVSPAFRVD
uniref:PCI domain-containing protein n=1 Tax=Macrostomum lignano TaxID=282301 RepID=A0A1I8GED1_9PLAT